MQEYNQTLKPYEEQRIFLGSMNLIERREAILRSQGLTPSQDFVFGQLNGHSYTPVKQYLEEINQREKKK